MTSPSLPNVEELTPRRRLREALGRQELLTLPAVQDAFAARAAQDLGFEAVYLGGGAAVAIGRHAIPDMTMVSCADMIEAARPMVEAIDIPLVIDFDDAGGNPLQVRRNVRLAEAAGVSGLQIEDTDFSYPKHLPPAKLGTVMSFSDNHILDRDAAVQRVRAAVEARRDPDLIIIARTDADLISREESMARMELFAEAGADVVYPSHFNFADTKATVEAVNVPVMGCPIRVGSSTPEERQQARDGGMRILLEATPVLYAGYRAVLESLTELRDTGGVDDDFSHTLKAVQEIISYPQWGDFARRYAT